MSDTILVERDVAIATVVLNRPRKLNALTKSMWRHLGEVMTRLSQGRRFAVRGVAWGRRIAEGAPLVARWHKRFLRRLDDPTPLSQAERDEGFDCFDTEDFQIGTRSFLDKTKPEFRGR